jgi:hypothetical protein
MAIERINSLIEEETLSLTNLRKELEELECKWFKFSSHRILIEFLRNFIELKRGLIKECGKMEEKYDRNKL